MAVLVLDCSATVAPFLPGEEPVTSLRELAEGGAIVPSNWRLEVGQALLVAERRRRISTEDRRTILRELALLPIKVDEQTGERAWRETLAFAEAETLSLYDAAYLELAVRSGLPLATKDRALAAAAMRCGVAVR